MRALGKEYKEAEAASDFERLPAGGYVCKIVKVTDYPAGDKNSDKPFLNIVFDIAEGEYARYYDDDWGHDVNNEWAHSNRHYYTPKSFGMFKGFLKAVDESNGTNFEEAAEEGFDERKLVGLLVGYIIGEEEYESNLGEIRTRLRVRSARSVQAIREGRYKQPEKKTIQPKPEIQAAPDPNADDLPF